MLYVVNSKILNKNQLYKAVGESRGVIICRADPPRQEDLDEWGAFELQPDQPPTADIVTATNIAEQLEDGLWYRVYETRSYTQEELTQHQRNSLQQVNSYMDHIVNNLADYYPPYERDTWPQQESEAKAYANDNTTLTPVMDAIMGERGLTDRLQFANNVIAKADAYRALAASYAGRRQSYRDRINNATTRADIDAIVAEVHAL